MEGAGNVRRESDWQITIRQTPKVLMTCILLAIAIIGALSLLKATCFGSLSIGPLDYIPFEASIAVTAVGVLGVVVLFVYFCRNQHVSERGERRKTQATNSYRVGPSKETVRQQPQVIKYVQEVTQNQTVSLTEKPSVRPDLSSQTVVKGQVPPQGTVQAPPPGDSSANPVALPKSPSVPSTQTPPQLIVPVSPAGVSPTNPFASPRSPSTPSQPSSPGTDAELRAHFLNIEATAYARRETYNNAIAEILKQKRKVYHISWDDSNPRRAVYLTSNGKKEYKCFVYEADGSCADSMLPGLTLQATEEELKKYGWVSLSQSLGIVC